MTVANLNFWTQNNIWKLYEYICNKKISEFERFKWKLVYLLYYLILPILSGNTSEAYIVFLRFFVWKKLFNLIWQYKPLKFKFEFSQQKTHPICAPWSNNLCQYSCGWFPQIFNKIKSQKSRPILRFMYQQKSVFTEMQFPEFIFHFFRISI